MNVLLDTHVWIWRLLQPERVSARADEALSDPETTAYLSPISVWETLVLARKRRVELAPDPASWVQAALQRSSAVMAPFTHEVAQRSEALPGYPSRDPADRFLIATALVHGLVVVTADAEMQGYEPLATLW